MYSIEFSNEVHLYDRLLSSTTSFRPSVCPIGLLTSQRLFCSLPIYSAFFSALHTEFTLKTGVGINERKILRE